jgi:hypothetical protein
MEGQAVEPRLVQEISRRDAFLDSSADQDFDATGVDLALEVGVERQPEPAQHEERGFVARVAGAVAVMQLRARKPPRRVADQVPQLQGRSARSVSR